MSTPATALEKLYQEDLYQIPPRVLVILSKPWTDIADNDKIVLQKMMGAVRQHIDTVQIINRASFSLDEVAALSPSKVLVFGVPSPAAFKPYELTTSQGIPVIVAESLEALDDARKKTLWLALKQMFAL